MTAMTEPVVLRMPSRTKRIKLRCVWAGVFCLFFLAGCSRQPHEEVVSHPSSLAGGTWLRSEYNIVARDVKEYPDHSGEYVVVTLRYGDKRITAQCGTTWTTETGEDLPTTPLIFDHCSHLPMGPVKLDRTDWSTLYYFSGSGNHREEIVLSVKKVEVG